jgi:phage terminase large subunit-like protein
VRKKPVSRADRIIAFIERFCLTPEGALVGRPMVLADFQREFIRAVYDNPAGTRRAYLSIGRKNGKSSLIAALLLAHLVGPEAAANSQIVSGARSRDQAALVFELARKMVALSAGLRPLVRVVPSGKRLIGLARNVEYRALAAEGTTAHGLSPVLAILDEVGQVRGPQDAFIDAITTAQGAHAAPLLIAISTQAPSDTDLFSVWLDDARTSSDPRIVSHVYEAPKDCDLNDEDAWRAANPALGVFRSLDDVREQAAQAARMPSFESTFRVYTLNQRVEARSPFVSRSVWVANEGDAEPYNGAPVSLGLDLSSVADLTALVACWRGSERLQVRCWFWTPELTVHDRSRRDRVPYDVWVREGHLLTTPGAAIDYDHVARTLLEAVSEFEVASLQFDRWRMDQFRGALQRQGADDQFLSLMRPFGQGFASMGPALDMLERELLAEHVSHGMHPVLTMCAANAVVSRDPAGNRKFDKQRATGRIDGMVALAMAIAGIEHKHEAESAEMFAEVW